MQCLDLAFMESVPTLYKTAKFQYTDNDHERDELEHKQGVVKRKTLMMEAHSIQHMSQ